jgi:PAS domain-containing protein
LILEANLTCAALLGIERDHLIKKPLILFVIKNSQDLFYLHRRKVFDDPEQQTSEIKLKKKDGPEFYAYLESISLKTWRAINCVNH